MFKFRREFVHYCRDCINFKEGLNCSDTQVKNAQPDTDYCLWYSDKYEEKK